ncbi:hypothetical protein BDV93DRAFT_517182 [Ceratobasidium sp. AG-I]|nr:hypothetical protein BDV93DRAFT_517182 [Ceratobasidium sp. AG-I]
MRRSVPSILHLSLLVVLGLSNVSLGKPLRYNEVARDHRSNTTAHLVFNTVSSLLQHWPNTIYRNGHTFVPAVIPSGTLLHHARTLESPPPSPEYFAFDVEHSYIFCFWAPCIMFTYATRRDLRVGYFDGTSSATLEGPRDLQDILFNKKFIPPDEYDPWTHAGSMCVWAKKMGLDGIARMEPSFEAILCNIDADLNLVSKLEIMYPKTMQFPGMPSPMSAPTDSTNSAMPNNTHPRLKNKIPVFPGPNIPVFPPPPGWKGDFRDHESTAFEAVRAGMWHNGPPGEARIRLDYSGIVSAYDETYTSLVESRHGVPRSRHRLGDISDQDKERLRAEAQEVLSPGRPAIRVNWPSLFQAVVDRHAERFEDLRYILRQSDADPVKTVAAARHRVLVMLTPYMVLPQIRPRQLRPSNEEAGSSVGQSVLAGTNSQSGPDSDWMTRIYNACAGYATAGILKRGELTMQEERLARSLEGVQKAICSSLTGIWETAFDSEDQPVFAKRMVADWRTEVEQLMEWLDWHMWIKCDPPCAPGLQCVLTTWPWEIRSGDEDLGPTCKDKLSYY